MTVIIRPRTLALLALLAAALMVGAGANGVTAQATGDFEVWTTVQGTHEVHVLAPVDGQGDDLEVVDVIDYKELTGPGGAWEGTSLLNPHMVLFGLHGKPGGEYAYVSNVASHNTSIIDASAREIVEVLDTGTRTHAVQPSPDGSRALAVAIGAPGIDGCEVVFVPACGQVAEIITDTENGVFTLGRTYNFSDFPADSGWEGLPRFDPVCGSFTPDSRFFYVTLTSGGLVIFEVNDDPSEPLFDVVRVYPSGTGRGEVAPNGCGVGYSTNGKRMFANSATPDQSFYYVFNLNTNRLIRTIDVSDGVADVHGMMLSPRGDEVVMVGRLSDNFIVINQKSGTLKKRRGWDLDLGDAFTGSEADPVIDPAPDLVDFSPDGRYIYVTMRGPNPATGTHSISGFPPGVAVIDFDTGETVQVVELPSDPEDQDPHGIAVRRIDE